MKLVLGSQPEGKKAITKKIIELVGKKSAEISVCIINEASALSDKDRRWLVDAMGKIAKDFGGKIGFCNLLALNIKEVEKQIMEYDVVWCLGGNTDYLKYLFDKTGFSAILPKILRSKVWVGSSAGSCVLGKRHAISKSEYGMVKEMLGIVDCCIRPHIWEPDAIADKYNYDNLLKESSRQKVYALSNDAAVIVDGRRIYLHGKRAEELVNGKVVSSI